MSTLGLEPGLLALEVRTLPWRYSVKGIANEWLPCINGSCYARILPTEIKNQNSVPFDFLVIAHSTCTMVVNSDLSDCSM